MELKPGSESSEFFLTKLVIYAGLSLDAFAMVLEGLKNAGYNFGWLPAILGVVGSLMVLVKAMGYTRARAVVKAAHAIPVPAASVGADLAPLLQGLLAELEAKKATSLPGGLPMPPSNP